MAEEAVALVRAKILTTTTKTKVMLEAAGVGSVAGVAKGTVGAEPKLMRSSKIVARPLTNLAVNPTPANNYLISPCR